MRDPNRLDKYYETLLETHKSFFPDWRISQFMLNFFSWHMNTYKTDGFYVEEDEFIKRVKNFTIEMARW